MRRTLTHPASPPALFANFLFCAATAAAATAQHARTDTTTKYVVIPSGAPAAANAAAAADLARITSGPLRAPTRDNAFADSLVLRKSERELTLYRHGKPVRTYLVALGRNPVGDKVRRGDARTPEGLFRIEGRNAFSKYHLSLHISYPDAAHRARAAQLGVSPGGDVMIHGLPDAFATVGALHRQQDWTEGCVALTNSEIEEIWRAIPDGAPILIKP